MDKTIADRLKEARKSEDVRETNVRRRCLNVSQMSVGLKKGGKCAYELE